MKLILNVGAPNPDSGNSEWDLDPFPIPHKNLDWLNNIENNRQFWMAQFAEMIAMTVNAHSDQYKLCLTGGGDGFQADECTDEDEVNLAQFRRESIDMLQMYLVRAMPELARA